MSVLAEGLLGWCAEEEEGRGGGWWGREELVERDGVGLADGGGEV